MKRLFIAAALMLGIASCQNTPEELDIIIGSEVQTRINVSIPNTETRSGGLNSALGVFDNDILAGNTTMRYILQVFYNGEPSTERLVKYSDNASTSFDVRLIPNRDYRFVVWADVVTNEDDTDNHYDTSDLTNITLRGTWNAMDESRDAFTGYVDEASFTGSSDINIILKRPLAKLRIMTTDIPALSNLGVSPKSATLRYTSDLRTAFNAYSSQAKSADLDNMEHTAFTISPYGSEVGTLFTDYLFAENDVVKFEFTVFDQNDATIKYNNFNTDINVRRNYLTTISGNILTDGNNIQVDITDAFDNQDNTTDPDYNIGTISSLAEFVAAVENGGNYIIISDLSLSNEVSTLSASALYAENKKTTINLNGRTITVKNSGTTPLVAVALGNTLTFAGEGNIVVSSDSTAAFINNNGTINLEGGTYIHGSVAVIDNTNGTTNINGGSPTTGAISGGIVKSVIDLLNDVVASGGSLTLYEDIAYSDTLLVTTTNPITIDGNGHALTSSATRAIRITTDNADVTIDNLNIVVTTERINDSDIRGISIDNAINDVKLTLNNSSVAFTAESTFDWSSGVDISGNSEGDTININGGSYEGANAINIWGDKHIVNIDNATLTSLYGASEWYFGYGIAVEGSGVAVNVANTTFVGSNAAPIGSSNASANTFNMGSSNNTEAMNYYRFIVGNSFYYTLAEAFTATTNGTVVVIHDAELDTMATIANGKSIILDLNGKNIVGSDSTIANFALINNQGTLSITGPGTISLTANKSNNSSTSTIIANSPNGELLLGWGVIIEHLGGTDMAYGIINATSGNDSLAVATIDRATIKSSYQAVYQQLNGTGANNTIIIKEGSTIEGVANSIGVYSVNTNANTGTLVVDSGATLNGDLYLYVTEGSTTWPLDLSVAASALNGEVLYANIPNGYEVENLNGTYTITNGKIMEGLYQPNNSTYVVSNEAGLTWIYSNMAANSNYAGMTIQLACDITLDSAWTPLGTLDDPFAGSFDGKGYTISNLTVANSDYAAFIAYAAEGVNIKDLTLESVNIQSTKHAAGVVCIGNGGLTFENITVSGSIEAANYAGGICHNIGDVTISNCTNHASVSAQRAAGIASWATVNANIANCTNYGDVTATVGASGIAHGFAGTIIEATNYGAITSTGIEPAAGIIGIQKASSTYEYCTNYGSVTTTKDDPNSSAAGILGQTPGSTATLTYCANYGAITAEQCYAAGIAYSLYGSVNASYCYNGGAVAGADGAGAIAPKAQFGTDDKAAYCLNSGSITSANGTIYQASNNNTSCYYYNNGALLNVGSNTVANVNEALATLNGGADSDFFTIANGEITAK